MAEVELLELYRAVTVGAKERTADATDVALISVREAMIPDRRQTRTSESPLIRFGCPKSAVEVLKRI
jgi:hypothetical protein